MNVEKALVVDITNQEAVKYIDCEYQSSSALHIDMEQCKQRINEVS